LQGAVRVYLSPHDEALIRLTSMNFFAILYFDN